MNYYPKVCVVIPCYNHGEFIDEAIKSIQSQTFQDFEIIVIDDGSTDEFTKKKINELNYPKTKVIIQNNSGPVVARNNAISLTMAEYILPLDADDFFESTYLEKAVKVLDSNPETGAVACHIQIFGDINYVVRVTGGTISDFIVRNNACVSTMFRKTCWEQVNGYNPNMKDGYEDWDFWLSITERGWTIYALDEVLFNYRKLERNSRDKNADKLRSRLIKQIAENHLDLFRNHIVSYVFEKEKEILELKDQYNKTINSFYRSYEYRVGKYILNPHLLVKKLLKRRK